eukprot:TRINITY_DN8692_c0_g1_i2.p1 TRINITY_DN8692_c0_g1~~TRINITY_DN8692_c0_g1_i2.p1  ORF type:complete len:508 (+),score=48.88 TRINITY_DN8692_c0_g1_i2:103-1626(+)
MQRGLVGSEMCIRDRYQRRVHGETLPAFRKRGPSKEKRPNPIVQMGLFMDTNGIPIAFRLFPGNCVDVKTYLPAVEQIKKQFGIERIVVVADKGMNSKNNIIETLKNKDGYLFSQKVRGTRGAPKDIQKFALDSEDWIINEQETFAKKSMIRKRKVDKKEITEKILVTWNQKYDFREKIRREKSVEYAEKLTAGERFRMTMKKGGKRYLDVETVDEETGEIKRLVPHISIDEEKIAFDEQFDGINVLITSETEMSDQEMLDSYRSLSRIEDCFKVLKTNFDARPIYVWTQPHIEAHFLICFISLTIMRLLEHKLEWQLSPERIQSALLSAQCHPLEKGYWEVFGNEDFLKINELLGKKWSHQFVPLEVLRTYAKQSVFTTISKQEKSAKNRFIAVFLTDFSFMNCQSREQQSSLVYHNRLVIQNNQIRNRKLIISEFMNKYNTPLFQCGVLLPYLFCSEWISHQQPICYNPDFDSQNSKIQMKSLRLLEKTQVFYFLYCCERLCMVQ